MLTTYRIVTSLIAADLEACTILISLVTALCSSIVATVAGITAQIYSAAVVIVGSASVGRCDLVATVARIATKVYSAAVVLVRCSHPVSTATLTSFISSTAYGTVCRDITVITA